MAYRLIRNIVQQHSFNRSFANPMRWSWYPTSVRHMCYDPDGKTIAHILNKQVDKWLMIDSYSQVGFRLNNGLFIFGPVAVFPNSVLSWNVASEDDVNEDSLSLFLYLEPKIDILVLGLGENAGSSTINQSLISITAKHKINLEILTTEQACTTFNFLNSENRNVVAALIPPISMRINEDDVFISKYRHKQLYSTEDFDQEAEQRHIK